MLRNVNQGCSFQNLLYHGLKSELREIGGPLIGLCHFSKGIVKKRAFTLVELLVVVAIIAILASILFPIFANSKRSPGSGSTTAHLQQITTAELLYQSDYNGDFVLSVSDGCNAGCPSTSPFSCISNLPSPTPNWAIILEPYLGSYSTYVDPSVGDSDGIFAPGSPNYRAVNWNFDTQYGYNYEFLSPITFQSTANFGNGFVDCFDAIEGGLGRSAGAAVSPATTVLFTTAQNFATQWSSSFAFQTLSSGFANAPGTEFALLPSADRVVDNGFYCFGSSGAHNVPVNIALGYCGWAAADPIGLLTADVRSLSPYPYATVAWVDGHISTATASELAGGTDFATATAASHPDPTYGFNTGAIVNGLASSGHSNLVGATNALGLAAPSGYLWSLDGTLSDIN